MDGGPLQMVVRMLDEMDGVVWLHGVTVVTIGQHSRSPKQGE